MNNPVGLTFTAASEPLGTMTYFTNPAAGQRDAIMYWTEGGVYPKPNTNIARDKLPLTGELMPVVSKYSRVAPAGITRYRSNALGDDYFDNLFSAQFNTHRVLRHKLIRDGASFKTIDEVFFSTENEDFHPTDVQEDGDGSLLVVETGGWFIQGCPLSQVSKPELKGSIYRVKLKDAPKVQDPFGKVINWNSLSPEQTINHLTDARPFVVDHAVQTLARNPQASSELSQFLTTSKNVQARIKSVFALYRMGTAESIAAAQKGLSDTELEVRLAAARVAGLAKNKSALNELLNMVANDSLPCKRQAATALGQIGDASVIAGLLDAAAGIQDRYVQHAITYALITLNDPKKIRMGLHHKNNEVRRVAMIALDQMQQATLSAGEVLPYLASGDSVLQSTSFWVISHHPEWAGEIVSYLNNRMSKPELTTTEESQLREILVAYSNNTIMQQFIATQFEKASAHKKLFLLETMGASNMAEFPENWSAILNDELATNADLNIQLKILSLARLYNLSQLTKTVEQVANQDKNEDVLRMAALGFLIKDSVQISQDHFNFLLDQLGPEVLAPNRLQAAAILSQGMLAQQQLMTLATEFLPKADAFILPRVLPVFKQGTEKSIGQAVVTALLNSPTLDSFSEEIILQTFKNYPPELNKPVEELIAKLNEAQAERLNKIKEIEANILTGDIERGRALFFGKAVCSSCHAIGNEGGKFGPDLTAIQRDRSHHDLVEAIVYPGASFVREFETYQINSGQSTYRGVILEQNAEFILLAISPQETVRISIKEITSIKTEDVSMMPQGLDQLLSKQELADLLAFLIGQEQDPETDSKLLR
jgi:putative heme-binding domain-containing protein